MRIRVGAIDTVIDLVVETPDAGRHKAAAVQPGHSAGRAHRRKLKLYTKNWIIRGERLFTPFALEAYGRWHPDARKLVASVVRRAVMTKPERKDWTRDEHDAFSRGMQTVLQAVSVALARTVALSLLRLADAVRGAAAGPPAPAAPAEAGSDEESSEEEDGGR